MATALITGGNRGLGLALVRALLVRGDHVVAACRHPGRATELNRLSGEHPGRLHVLPLDVADAKSQAELARELPLVLGDGGRVDLLVNNAGVLHSGERFGKVAQNMATVLLAQALAERGIVVLALHPGWVQTEMGGKDATVAAEDAAEGLLRVIDGAGRDDSGRFLDFRGGSLPW